MNGKYVENTQKIRIRVNLARDTAPPTCPSTEVEDTSTTTQGTSTTTHTNRDIALDPIPLTLAAPAEAGATTG